MQLVDQSLHCWSHGHISLLRLWLCGDACLRARAVSTSTWSCFGTSNALFLPDQLVFARTWPLSRLVFARTWPLSRSAQLCFICVCYIVPGRACEANDQRSAQRSVRSVGISDRSVGDLRSTGGKVCKKLDAAGRFESFFSLSLERERSAGEMAHRCTHTGASVFDRRQKFCDSASRLDGLAKLSSRSNGLEGQTEPEIKRCGPTRVRNWCINASVTCDPRQNKFYYQASQKKKRENSQHRHLHSEEIGTLLDQQSARGPERHREFNFQLVFGYSKTSSLSYHLF